MSEYYSIDKSDEEEESSEKEKEEIDTVKALIYIEKLKLWKLQKGNNQDLQALDHLEREIVQYRSSTTIQTTIHRFFEPIP